MGAHGSDEAASVIGRPFAKGQSGNPGGRPKLPDWFRERGPDALKKIVAVMDGKDDEGAPVVDEKVTPAMAAQWIADRLYGKAPQAPEDADQQKLHGEAVLALLWKRAKGEDPGDGGG